MTPHGKTFPLLIFLGSIAWIQLWTDPLMIKLFAEFFFLVRLEFVYTSKCALIRFVRVRYSIVVTDQAFATIGSFLLKVHEAFNFSQSILLFSELWSKWISRLSHQQLFYCREMEILFCDEKKTTVSCQQFWKGLFILDWTYFVGFLEKFIYKDS